MGADIDERIDTVFSKNETFLVFKFVTVAYIDTVLYIMQADLQTA